MLYKVYIFIVQTRLKKKQNSAQNVCNFTAHVIYGALELVIKRGVEAFLLRLACKTTKIIPYSQ